MFEKVRTSDCTIQDVHELIEQCHATGNTPVFIGDSGIGKTYTIGEYAAMRKMHMEVLNCSELFVEDFGAIRDINGYVGFALNEIFNVPKKGTALFFIDEFSRARGDLRNLIAGMVNERKIYGKPIPENIRFVIAMNPPTEDYGDTDDPFVDMATARRYALFMVKASVEDWLAWAKRNKVDQKTRTFMYLSSPYRPHWLEPVTFSTLNLMATANVIKNVYLLGGYMKTCMCANTSEVVQAILVPLRCSALMQIRGE